MKKIDSDALGELTKALGLTGAGSPLTELADGVVDQALDVVPIIRRGRTIGQSQGLFTGSLQNFHTDAETVTNNIDPYAPGTTFAVPPFPAVVPAQFDVWLLNCTVRRQSGTGTLSAALFFQAPAQNQAWGRDDGGGTNVQQDMQALAFWDSVITLNTTFGVFAAAHGPLVPIGIRLPRGTSASTGLLRFVSTSSATSVYNLSINFGLFPVTLGQDGVV